MKYVLMLTALLLASAALPVQLELMTDEQGSDPTNTTTTPATTTSTPATTAPTTSTPATTAPTTSTPATTAPTTSTPATTAPTTSTPATTAPTTSTPATTAPTTSTPATTAPTTSTPATTAAPTTAAPTTTSKPPNPKPPTAKTPVKENYKVKDGNDKFCVKMSFSCQFTIPYNNTNKKLVHAYLNIDNGTVDANSSFCKDTTTNKTQQMSIKWGKNTLNLVFNQSDSKSYIEAVTLDYFTDSKRFPLHESGEVMETTSAKKLKLFSASNARSYKCSHEQDVKLADGIVMSVTNVQAQAATSGFADKYNMAEICSLDDKTSNIVPIAVGCALAALVVIVLIAYCIGRRRSKQKGYQSV